MLVKARTDVRDEAHWRVSAWGIPAPSPTDGSGEGRIFAFRDHGIDYFPGYGLDPHAGYRLLKTLAEVIQAVSETKDEWRTAYWF